MIKKIFLTCSLYFFAIHIYCQPKVINTYNFYNTLSTTEADCANDLIPEVGLTTTCENSTAPTAGEFIIDTISSNKIQRTVYHNNLNWGLKYLNADGVIEKSYTVQLYIKVVNFNMYYTRIIDFSNGKEDNGIYFTDFNTPPPAEERCLNFYPTGNFGTCPFFNNKTYYLISFTRNDLTKTMDVYVNDQLFTTYHDAADFYTSTKNKPVYLFRDDSIGFACEDGEANFAYLSFSNFYSSAADISSDYKNITRVANPNDFTIQSQPICKGQPVTINYSGDISGSDNSYKFKWNWDGGNVISGSNRGPYKVSWSNAGIKEIQLNITGGACPTSITNSKKISVMSDMPHPKFESVGNLCAGDSLVLSPGNFLSYLWQDNSMDSIYKVRTPGLYSVTVSNGCGSASAQINIAQSICDIFFPTAFTPNNDGLNDKFKILSDLHFSVFNLQIYNRYGQKIFESKNPSVGWNGKLNGQDQAQGGYVWYCKLKKSSSDKIQNLKGIVVLIR